MAKTEVHSGSQKKPLHETHNNKTDIQKKVAAQVNIEGHKALPDPNPFSPNLIKSGKSKMLAYAAGVILIAVLVLLVIGSKTPATNVSGISDNKSRISGNMSGIPDNTSLDAKFSDKSIACRALIKGKSEELKNALSEVGNGTINLTKKVVIDFGDCADGVGITKIENCGSSCPGGHSVCWAIVPEGVYAKECIMYSGCQGKSGSLELASIPEQVNCNFTKSLTLTLKKSSPGKIEIIEE